MGVQGKLLCKLEKSSFSEVVQVDSDSLEPAEACNLDGQSRYLLARCGTPGRTPTLACEMCLGQKLPSLVDAS